MELILPQYQQTYGRLATNKHFCQLWETVELKPLHVFVLSRLSCFMALFGLAEFMCLDFWKFQNQVRLTEVMCNNDLAF